MVERRTLELSRKVRVREIERKESELRAIHNSVDRKSRERKAAENSFEKVRVEAKKILLSEKPGQSKSNLVKALKSKLKKKKGLVEKEKVEVEKLSAKAKTTGQELQIMKNRVKVLDKKINEIKVREDITQKEIQFDNLIEQAVLRKEQDEKIENDLVVDKKDFNIDDSLDYVDRAIENSLENNEYKQSFSGREGESQGNFSGFLNNENQTFESSENSRNSQDKNSNHTLENFQSKLESLRTARNGDSTAISFKYFAENGSPYEVSLVKDKFGEIQVQIFTKSNADRFRLNSDKKILSKAFKDSGINLGQFKVSVNKNKGEY